jgi:Uma2 family endonuclease
MVIQQKLIDAAEFWELAHQPENAEKSLELVEGAVIEMSRPGGEHGVVTMDVGYYVRHFVGENNLGFVTVESGYVLFKNPTSGKDTVRGPDVGFVRLERAPDGLPEGYVPFPPDLAVEVVSPNDNIYDLDAKIAEYLRAGVSLVWVLYPRKRALVHTPQGETLIPPHGALDGGDVLPGFSLPLAKVFGQK